MASGFGRAKVILSCQALDFVQDHLVVKNLECHDVQPSLVSAQNHHLEMPIRAS